MGASSEWFLKLREEEFNSLEHDEQMFLIHLGTTCQQSPGEDEEQDHVYQSLRKERIKSWQKEQDYLFKKRNKIK